MVKYYFENGNFVIDSYDKSKTFSSFLPGIAGLKGIPMWVFYVNRGQGVGSFGVENKNGSILEFSPASITYQNVSRNGFRTFLKINGKVVEPFTVLQDDEKIVRKMLINEAQFSIIERNEADGYEIKVDYFGVPQENFAALARKVEIKNISNKEMNIEVIDGCTSILPSGVDLAGYKAVGNLLRSWMEVYELDKKIAFYKLRASTGDSAEIKQVNKGNFYLSFSDEEELITPIVDADLIFGYDTSLAKPVNFLTQSVTEIVNAKQVTANKVPCGFTGLVRNLKPNDVIHINTLIGHVHNFEHIEIQKNKIVSLEYINKKQIEAYKIIRELTNDIETNTGNELFDEYVRQCYLDNLLRGGYPYVIKNDKKDFIYYIYSRKHGDLERDYNWYSIAPEYYSQGNGNFRDANQNRRNDVLFHPNVGTHNIKTFMSLIQMDGYNPLSVNGSSFNLVNNTDVDTLVDDCFSSHQEELKNILRNKFTPGRIINFVYNQNVSLKVSESEMLNQVFSVSEQNIEANFGEGYWIDHWTYNMDLIDTYLQVFPDKEQDLFFMDYTYKFFDSPVYIYPRREKYVLNKEGQVRQYGAINHHDELKLKHLGIKVTDTNWLRTKNGKGEIYQNNLFIKLFSLAMIKFATLDPEGIGIEMEADKPGWNDAMNGLPGLFGSGVGETFELIRIVNLLNDLTAKYDNEVSLPKELAELLNGIEKNLVKYNANELTDQHYWDEVASLREVFRDQIRLGISGETTHYSTKTLKQFIQLMKNKLTQGIHKGKELGNGIYPTYLVYEATDYEAIKNESGEAVIGHYGLPTVKVKQFKVRPLPFFAEAPARSMKVIKNVQDNLALHQLVQTTDIYDKKLLMYKTSESIEQETHEIGRVRAFTPGWLEREAIFLHMTYKYLLGLIKASLYDEFFEAVKTNLVPFLDPKVYGRSTLENSSFIASSVNPNPSIHGQGFFARLTGSTAEVLSMWTLMMYGKKPFRYENGKLVAELKPLLPGWLFNEQGEISYKFLGNTKVTYINPQKKNTYALDTKVTKLVLSIGNNMVELHDHQLTGDYAYMLRNGEIQEVQVYLGN